MKLMIPFTPHLAHECLSNLNCKETNKWPKINEKVVEVIGDQTKRFASPIISVDGRLCSSIIRAPRLMQPAHSM